MRYKFEVLMLFIVLMACQDTSDRPSDFQLFQQVESSDSGIDFSNSLQEDVSTKENLLDFDYFYNGAGVGAGDINNDGLIDLLFTGNQTDNRLYLNQGNLTFKDITANAGINVGKQWSNGVTFVDIDQDGWLDIYISQGGPRERDQRRNLFFKNNGDLTFTEMATDLGLADEGISTQSAFFDFDKDGDQDCFVMNESELYGYDPITFHRTLLESGDRYDVSYSQLYENRDGKFVNISVEAGIVKPTFGLGLVISDINHDGWPDIYVANDYYLPDNMYINRKNGSFSDRIATYTKQQSFFGMGADIADINNDGYNDIGVLDMASKDHIRSKTLMASMDVESFDLLVNQFRYPYQYMFNSLQLNDGTGRFNNVAQMCDLAKTDWSWSILMEDYNLDGLKDVFVTNGYRRYALDNDFKAKVTEAKMKHQGQVPLSEKKALYDQMPSESLPNEMFINQGDLRFNSVNDEWGLDLPTFSNGAISADLDNDGDLDLAVSNIDQQALLYENLASDKSNNRYLKVKTENDVPATVSITVEDRKQTVEIKRVRGYMSSSEPIAIFGLGTNDVVDKLTVTFDDGATIERRDIESNQTITFARNQANPSNEEQNKEGRKFTPLSPLALTLNYKHSENVYNDFSKEILLPQKQSTLGPGMEVFDVNGDDLDDIFITGASGQAAELYLQQDGRFIKSACVPCEEDKQSEGVEVEALDIDSDGDLDLYIVNGGNEWEEGNENYTDRLYINDGKGNFSAGSNLIPSQFASGGTAKKIDFDQDGDDDLILANRIVPQQYPRHAASYIFENQNGILVDVTQERAPILSDLGILNDVLPTDFNGDGWIDLIVAGEWTPITLLQNNNGVFAKSEFNKTLDEMAGWWYTIHETDINKDGLPDYLVGNVGLNFKHKSSPEKPFKVFAHDFDENGSLDIVLSQKYKDDYVPSRGRECSSEQMPFILEKFPTYQEFASASLIDVYGDSELDEAYNRSATEFRSGFLINQGEGHFSFKPLPRMALGFPLLDAMVKDLNGDGLDDFLIAGCIYNTEVETPRMDAGSGLCLVSQGNGHYEVMSSGQYQIHIPGNVKKLANLTLDAGGEILVAISNDGPISLFEIDTRS